jgi:hypothetical protein
MIFLVTQLTSKILLDSVGRRGLHSIQPPAVGTFKRRCQYSTNAKMPQPPLTMPRPGNGNDDATGLGPPRPPPPPPPSSSSYDEKKSLSSLITNQILMNLSRRDQPRSATTMETDVWTSTVAAAAAAAVATTAADHPPPPSGAAAIGKSIARRHAELRWLQQHSAGGRTASSPAVAGGGGGNAGSALASARSRLGEVIVVRRGRGGRGIGSGRIGPTARGGTCARGVQGRRLCPVGPFFLEEIEAAARGDDAGNDDRGDRRPPGRPRPVPPRRRPHRATPGLQFLRRRKDVVGAGVDGGGRGGTRAARRSAARGRRRRPPTPAPALPAPGPAAAAPGCRIVWGRGRRGTRRRRRQRSLRPTRLRNFPRGEMQRSNTFVEIL